MTIIRPKIKLLDEEHQAEILREAKDILENQGIFLENQEAIELFEQYGISHDDRQFYIPPDVVDKCLKSAPSSITLYDREGKESMTLQKDQIHYDPGSAAIFILDENNGEIREAISKDFIRFSKIVGHLDHIDAQSTALVYNDVPKDAQDWHRLYLALSNFHEIKHAPWKKLYAKQ